MHAMISFRLLLLKSVVLFKSGIFMPTLSGICFPHVADTLPGDARTKIHVRQSLLLPGLRAVLSR